MPRQSVVIFQLNTLLKRIVKQEFKLNIEPEVKLSKSKNYGDLSTTLALSLLSLINKKKTTYRSPKELACYLVEELNKLVNTQDNEAVQLKNIFSKIEVINSGFINFWFTDKYLHQHSCFYTKQFMKNALIDKTQGTQKVIVEFTDPNPFKEFHIGHLYSNVVGETISRLEESLGSLVKRVCYQGDVGMHVAKSVWGMKRKAQLEYPGISLENFIHELKNKKLEVRIKFLGEAYALGASAYENELSAKKEMQIINYYTFLAGQDYMVENNGWKRQLDYTKHFDCDVGEYQIIKKLYEYGKRWSLDYFATLYSTLGMSFDQFFFESQVGEVGIKIVRQFLKKGVFEQSQGAVIFPGKAHGLHDRVFINSLGLPTYEAKELGLAPAKYEYFAYDRSIIITGNEIDEYFKVLLKAMSLTYPLLATKTTHLSHGMVRLPDGKMSSRTGKILTGQWLIEEAKKTILQHLDVNKPSMELEKKLTIAHKVAMGAIKYALLKSSIGGDINFSFKESLAFVGNSGPYLQYTAVRCFGVLHKAAHQLFNSDISLLFDSLSKLKIDKDLCFTSLDIDIQRNLVRYLDVLRLSAEEKQPHHLATYLYALAQEVSLWYDKEKILKPQCKELNPENKSKLLLIRSIYNVFEHGLNILGIDIPEEM